MSPYTDAARFFHARFGRRYLPPSRRLCIPAAYRKQSSHQHLKRQGMTTIHPRGELPDQVILAPDEDDLAIVLRGDLAAMLSFAAGKRMPGFLSEAGLLGDLVSPVAVVAGVGFEPTTFRL
jgi:hypothetical protein